MQCCSEKLVGTITNMFGRNEGSDLDQLASLLCYKLPPKNNFVIRLFSVFVFTIIINIKAINN